MADHDGTRSNVIAFPGRRSSGVVVELPAEPATVHALPVTSPAGRMAVPDDGVLASIADRDLSATNPIAAATMALLGDLPGRAVHASVEEAIGLGLFASQLLDMVHTFGDDTLSDDDIDMAWDLASDTMSEALAPLTFPAAFSDDGADERSIVAVSLGDAGAGAQAVVLDLIGTGDPGTVVSWTSGVAVVTVGPARRDALREDRAATILGDAPSDDLAPLAGYIAEAFSAGVDVTLAYQAGISRREHALAELGLGPAD